MSRKFKINYLTLKCRACTTGITGGDASLVLYGGGIAKLIDMMLGLRASEEQEHTGLDLTAHAETAYDHGVLGHGAPVTASAPSAQKVKTQA